MSWPSSHVIGIRGLNAFLANETSPGKRPVLREPGCVAVRSAWRGMVVAVVSGCLRGEPTRLTEVVMPSRSFAPVPVLVALLVLVFGTPRPAVALGPCLANTGTDWRSTLDYPNDVFFYADANTPEEPRWVKFTIMLCNPGTVYFQSGNTHRFHYDFAHARLQPFLSMSRQQFDDATLHAAGQQAVLGAVLIPGSGFFGEQTPLREIAIQLVRQDGYTREQVRDYFNLVKSRITGAAGIPTLYFPTLEQQPSAEANRAWLGTQGIQVSSASRWITRNTCYSQGWGIGTLRFVTGSQVGSGLPRGYAAKLRHSADRRRSRRSPAGRRHRDDGARDAELARGASFADLGDPVRLFVLRRRRSLRSSWWGGE